MISDILLSSLHEYQTIIPHVVTEEGHFLSYKVQNNHTEPAETRNRIRRGTRNFQKEILTDSDISEYRIFYKFSVFGKEFHFDLTLNTQFLSPGFHVEYHDSDGVLATSDTVSNCYYIGQSRKPFISTAAISNCNGLVCLGIFLVFIFVYIPLSSKIILICLNISLFFNTMERRGRRKLSYFFFAYQILMT